MNGGTLKFLLEAGGTVVRLLDTDYSTSRLLQPGGRHLGVRLVHPGASHTDHTDLTIVNNDDHWIVDDGDDCGLDHQDAINLILHAHGL